MPLRLAGEGSFPAQYPNAEAFCFLEIAAMSAPVLESSRAPVDLPAAEQAAGLSFLAIVRRRWPWVLVGLFIGIIGGLLAYSARPAVYQSNAQLLVVKKRENLPTAGDARMGYLEDYMATQATILKSETVLTAAARKIPNDLRSPFPTEIPDRVKALTGLFSVTREKDPTNPTNVSNVLNVSMKGSNPDDCQIILDVIVQAYRDVLKGVYDETTKERVDLLKTAIATADKRVKAEQAEQSDSAKKWRVSQRKSPK